MTRIAALHSATPELLQLLIYLARIVLIFCGRVLERVFGGSLARESALNGGSSRQRDLWILRPTVLRSGLSGGHLIHEGH